VLLNRQSRIVSLTVAGRYLHPTMEDMAAALKRFPRFQLEG
jgi:DNA-binding transcriptional LysR family regulator